MERKSFRKTDLLFSLASIKTYPFHQSNIHMNIVASMMKFEKELYNSRILVIDDDYSISTIIKESLNKNFENYLENTAFNR